MDKIFESLVAVASERTNKYRELANEMVKDLDGADERQVAEYIATHDADMRKVLGVSDIASKEANPELAKDYFRLLKRGQAMQDPDTGSRKDYYNEDIKDVDHFMELMGVKKENGAYSNDMRSAFTNPDSPKYYGKISRDDLQLAALQDGYENADELLSAMGQAGALYQGDRKARGYNPDNSTDVGAWLADLAQEIGFPRMREARLAGRDWTREDLFGDMAELGLNFVPGVGLVSKTGKWVAKVPNQYVGKALNGILMGAENAAVPVGTQAIDIALYDDDDPRGKWSTSRVGAQLGGITAARMGLTGLGQAGKHLLAAREGESAAREAARDFSGFVKSIGEKTDDVIARRQAMLDRKAELARQRQNVSLPGDRDISSAKAASTDDLIAADNYRILNDEARRIAKSEKERQKYRASVGRQEARIREFESPTYRRDANGNVVVDYWHDGNIAQQDLGHVGLALKELDRDIADAYRAVNEKGAREIVQLQDGRFVYRERVKPEGLDFGQDYVFPKTKTSSAEFTYEPANMPRDYVEPGVVLDESGVMKPVDRNAAVMRELEKPQNQVIARKLNPWKTEGMEVARDYVANVAADAASREGLVGQALNMDEKRQNAMWNSYMNRLRPIVADADVPPEEKKRRVDAIMNVMTYGLDNIPDEAFKAQPRVYHAIASQLGEPSWRHRSEVEEPSPTTSFSTYDESMYIPNSASSGN